MTYQPACIADSGTLVACAAVGWAAVAAGRAGAGRALDGAGVLTTTCGDGCETVGAGAGGFGEELPEKCTSMITTTTATTAIAARIGALRPLEAVPALTLRCESLSLRWKFSGLGWTSAWAGCCAAGAKFNSG